jgi:hypothetical protein
MSLLLLAAYIMLGGATYRHSGNAVLPDHAKTPGEADARLTTERLCSKHFHTRDERHVTASEKRLVCRAYGITSGCPGRGYELDHLISIELGGAESEANLWPQPVDGPGVIGFHAKDVLEGRAHRAVCSGRITLKEAQEGISGDWYGWGKRKGLIP